MTMKHPLECERLEARDMSSAVLAVTLFAASAAMIWDLASGPVALFEQLLSRLADGDG